MKKKCPICKDKLSKKEIKEDYKIVFEATKNAEIIYTQNLENMCEVCWENLIYYFDHKILIIQQL